MTAPTTLCLTVALAALQMPTAVPTGSPAPTASPIASPASAPLFPAATAAPSGAPTLPPSAYAYRFVPRQPANPAAGEPQIYAVYLNAKHLKSHGPIVIRVETNAFVVKMESKSNGRGGALPQVAPTVFFAQSTLPAIPFIASGMSTDLIFIGTAADGRKVTVRVPVELD